MANADKFNFFKLSNLYIVCPACGMQVVKRRINHHLDADCREIKITSVKTLMLNETGDENLLTSESSKCSKNDFEIINNQRNSSKNFVKNAKKNCVPSITTMVTSNDELIHKRLCKSKVIIISDDDGDDDCSNKLNLKLCNQSTKQSSSLITVKTLDTSLSLSQWLLKLEELTKKLHELSNQHIYDESHFHEWRKKLNPFRLFGFNCHQKQNQDSIFNDKIELNKNTSKTKENLFFQIESQNLPQEDKIKLDLIESIDAKKYKNSLMPYYLENFFYVIEKVLQSKDDSVLFDVNDIKILAKCGELSKVSLQLYIRLYLRKKGWFRCNKIQYPEICSDLSGSFQELIKSGYLTDEKHLNSLDEILQLLNANEVRQLSKDFHLVKSGSTLSKTDLCSMLKKHCVQQKSLFMFKKKDFLSTSLLMSKKAKEYLGQCVKLNEEVGFVFTRIFTLFSITNTHYEDVMHYTGYNQVYHLLQVNNGEVKYPSYTVNKKNKLFISSAELTSYTVAVEMERELDMFMEKKDLDAAYEVYTKVKQRLVDICEDICEDVVDEGKRKAIRYLSLPYFLSCYSEPWIIFRICGKSVEILEKRQEYMEAVKLLELLLSQKYFCNCARGGLWERLVIDTERYLKDLPKAICLIESALIDPFVRTGHRLGLLQRYQRLQKSPRCKKVNFNNSFLNEVYQFNQVQEEIICAEIFLEGSSSQRTVFSNSSGEDQSMSYVEQFVLDHYKDKGFPNGLHGEGSVVTTLFFLLFWEIIFMDVEDAFHGEFQCSPLDMYRDCFYLNRKDAIDKRLDWLYSCSDFELRCAIQESWNNRYRTVGVKWDLLKNASEAADLAICLGSKLLSGICELFCKDFRRRRGGFPDLILWNIEAKSCKIIEVKGPGDKLSTKQLVWLDVLTELGADAFVCYVKGGGKRKRK